MTVADWAAALRDTVLDSAAAFVAFVPKLLGAFTLLLLGYLLGRVTAATLSRILRLVGVDRVLSRTVLQTFLDRAGVQRATSDVLGTIGFWVIFLLFLISATETLELQIISQALTTLAFYLPRVGMAMLIIVLGFVLAGFLREMVLLACNSAGIGQGLLIARVLYVASILLVVVTAVNELGIDTTLMHNTIVLLLGGVVAGAALSFGLGARATVGNLIAAHYLRPVLRVGQEVQVGDIRGTIVSLTPVAVVVETEQGRVVVSASHFTEATPILDPERYGDDA